MGVGVRTSPLLYKDLVILLCDEDNGDKSLVVGLDKKTGKEVWRVPRKVQVSWATPVIVSANGGDELVASGTEAIIAYDPATGKERWRMKGLSSNAVPSPVAGKDVVVLSAGFPEKLAVAVRPGGSGDVTESRALWRYLLIMSQDGDTFVIKAGPAHEVLRTNPLGEPISASAAVSRGGSTSAASGTCSRSARGRRALAPG